MSSDIENEDDDFDFDALMEQLRSTVTACNKCLYSGEGCVLPKSTEVSHSDDDNDDKQLIRKVALLEDQLKAEKDRNLKIEIENGKLAIELSDCQKQLQTARELILSLTSARSSTTAEQEQIEVLEAQLSIYREDFESERRDHARDLAKMSNLEHTTNLLKIQLQQQSPTGLGPRQPPLEYLRENSGSGRTQIAAHHGLADTFRADLPKENP